MGNVVVDPSGPPAPTGILFEVRQGSLRLITRVVIRNYVTGEEVEEALWISDLNEAKKFVSIPDAGIYTVDYYDKYKFGLGPQEIGPKVLRDPITNASRHEVRARLPFRREVGSGFERGFQLG